MSPLALRSRRTVEAKFKLLLCVDLSHASLREGVALGWWSTQNMYLLTICSTGWPASAPPVHYRLLVVGTRCASLGSNARVHTRGKGGARDNRARESTLAGDAVIEL